MYTARNAAAPVTGASAVSQPIGPAAVFGRGLARTGSMVTLQVYKDRQ